MHLNGIARSAQHPAVGEDLAPCIEEPGPGPRRLDQAAHHVAGEIGEQDLPFIDRLENRPFAKRGGKDLALRLQRLDLLADKARLVFAEIKKPAGE